MSKSESNDIYILAYVNDKGEIIGFPMGGGSSTPASIRVSTKESSARRSAKYFPGSVVVKPTGFNII